MVKKVWLVLVLVFLSNIMIFALPSDADVVFVKEGSFSVGSEFTKSKVTWSVPSGKWCVSSVSIVPSTGGTVSNYTKDSGAATIDWNGKGKFTVTIKVTYKHEDGTTLTFPTVPVKKVNIIGIKSLGPDRGLNIPSNEECEKYIVCVKENDTVGITGTPDPEVADSDLPSDWKFEGHDTFDANNKRKVSVNLSEAGISEVKLTCGTDSACVQILKTSVTFNPTKLYVPENDATGKVVKAEVNPKESAPSVTFNLTNDVASFTKETTDGTVTFNIKGDKDGFGTGFLEAKIGADICNKLEIIRVDLIGPGLVTIVNSKTETKLLVYKTNPVGAVTYSNMSTTNEDVGKITSASSNEFKPGGNENVFADSDTKQFADVGVNGKINVAFDNNTVEFILDPVKTENKVRVKNAPPKIITTSKPKSPNFDTKSFSQTGKIELIDIDDVAANYLSGKSITDDGINVVDRSVKIEFKDQGTNSNGNKIDMTVEVEYPNAQKLFRHIKELSFSVGAGVEAGIIIKKVSFDAGVSGKIYVEVPGNKVSDVVGEFTSVVVFPAGSTINSPGNSSIKSFVNNTLSGLLNKTNVFFDLSINITDGGNNTKFFESEMDFYSKEASGNEKIVIDVFKVD